MRRPICLLSLLVLLPSMEVIAEYNVKVSYVDLSACEISANPIMDYPQPDKFENIEEYRSSMALYPSIKYQRFSGVGGCFNEIGGEALTKLNDADRERVLETLFNLDDGFTHCRVAIGSSDFGIDAYSFSNVADDWQMEYFSMDRDQRYMLPFIKEAIEVNPSLRLFGSPWSPPGWMKESGYMDRGVEFAQKNVLRDDPQVLRAYALYLARYVESYKSEGVDVMRIMIQNEQDANTKYPSCRVPVEQMTRFVAEYLHPIFKRRGVSAEIWAGTFRAAGELEGVKFAAESRSNKFFDGIGVQYTRSEFLADIRSLAPDLKIMHTEGNCFNGLNSIEQAKSRFDEVASYINGGCENFCYWNMILNETGLSGWDWRQNALITVDRVNQRVIYNPDYAVMKLISRFIRPGSYRIASYGFAPVISSERDGNYYLVMQNSSNRSAQYCCNIDGERLYFELPSNSLCGVEIYRPLKKR